MITDIQHPDLISAATTGQLCVQTYGKVFGGRNDFKYDVAWGSNIDAVEYIVAGGVVACSIHGVYEGTTPRTRDRLCA